VGSSGNSHLLVVKRVAETEWRAVEAEVGAEGIRVIGVGQIEAAKDKGPDLGRFGHGATVVLVANSRTSVCRLMQLADAAPDETDRMVALRLETELPYPADESTWACRRQNGTLGNGGGDVLVIASETEPIEKAEEELRRQGKRTSTIEFDGTALADLSVACCPETATVAIADIGPDCVTLVVVNAGVLRYMRRFAVSAEVEGEDQLWRTELARELDQSLYDYVYRTKGERPTHIILAGEESRRPKLDYWLRTSLNMNVDAASLPSGCDVDADDLSKNELLLLYPACVGVLYSVQRRMSNGVSAAPPLRSVSRTATPDAIKRRVILAVANAAVLVILVAISFGVRNAQIRVADRVIAEGNAMLRDIPLLEEEVSILKYESSRQRSILDVLVPLAEILPKGVKVETLGIDPKGVVKISGTTNSVEDVSDKTISAMERSPVFADPKFQGATKDKTGYSFRITVELRKVGGGI
jgi:hypothetical protein